MCSHDEHGKTRFNKKAYFVAPWDWGLFPINNFLLSHTACNLSYCLALYLTVSVAFSTSLMLVSST